ncbi:MAG: LysM peptidoglycan-binding domain-containing protein [Vallitalea sp.]|jgi:LysM repeat protein|nr:LysM peptidoglycan-binding domain-containing protein [Vallitalea sp.]
MKKNIKLSMLLITLLLMTNLTINSIASDDNNITIHEHRPEFKYLPTSFNIEIKKVDTNDILQHLKNSNPLDESEKKYLEEKGYSSEEINSMNYGEYYEIKKKCLLLPCEIKTVKNKYKELLNTDITTWTNEDLDNYKEEVESQIDMPTDNKLTQIKKRNITLDDAKYLLTKYKDYETVLEQSDETLKKELIKHYEWLLEYANNLINNKMTMIDAESISVTFEQPVEELARDVDIEFVITPKPQFAEYYVKDGDFLYKIAEKFKTNYKTLSELNKLKNPHLIYPGQKLLIPQQPNCTIQLIKPNKNK